MSRILHHLILCMNIWVSTYHSVSVEAKGQLQELVLPFHSMGSGIELRSSDLTPGTFCWWAIWLAPSQILKVNFFKTLLKVFVLSPAVHCVSSLAIIYGVFSASNLITPSVVAIVGPQISMFVSGLFYRWVVPFALWLFNVEHCSLSGKSSGEWSFVGVGGSVLCFVLRNTGLPADKKCASSLICVWDSFSL